MMLLYIYRENLGFLDCRELLWGGEKMKFGMGAVVGTLGAIAALKEANQEALYFAVRHGMGDWGDLSDEDKRANEVALKQGERLLSAYTLGSGVKLWVITEADRLTTTFLLPEEY